MTPSSGTVRKGNHKRVESDGKSTEARKTKKGDANTKPPAAAAATATASDDDDGGETKKRGWDEIESLFQAKKRNKSTKPLPKTKARKTSPHASVPQHNAATTGKGGGDWVDDGLGGVYNKEGYTGRVQDGMRIFKAHVIQQRPDAGQTDLCPFDCDCCYM